MVCYKELIDLLPPPLPQINVEYEKFDEGETIVRTAANNWVACRKSGHRRFFVVFTQNKTSNFAEINGIILSLSLSLTQLCRD